MPCVQTGRSSFPVIREVSHAPRNRGCPPFPSCGTSRCRPQYRKPGEAGWLPGHAVPLHRRARDAGRSRHSKPFFHLLRTAMPEKVKFHKNLVCLEWVVISEKESKRQQHSRFTEDNGKAGDVAVDPTEPPCGIKSGGDVREPYRCYGSAAAQYPERISLAASAQIPVRSQHGFDGGAVSCFKIRAERTSRHGFDAIAVKVRQRARERRYTDEERSQAAKPAVALRKS